MSPYVFVLAALAAYRLTRFVVHDSLLAPQRRWLFARFPPNHGMAQAFGKDRPSRIGQLFDCPYCIGFWLAGLVLLVASCLGYVPAVYAGGEPARYGWVVFVALWWALAGAQALLNAADGRLTQ